MRCLTKLVERLLFRDYILIVLAFSFLYTLSPHRFATHYPTINRNSILNNLKPLSIVHNVSAVCDYETVIKENKDVKLSDFDRAIDRPEEIQIGGEYVPKNCRPNFSVAVIVPYRNRETHLEVFQRFFHNYLRRQQIHYKVFIVEQNDTKPFNRGKLFNIGSKYASKLGFPCLILHDVDLIPMNLGNIFACTAKPRHMSSSLDDFRFNLPYDGLFGGAVAILSQTFEDINGFSNQFSGWGGEDDDLYERIRAKKLDICRFEPAFSRYTMLKHAKEKPNESRNSMLKYGYLRYDTDGLNSLEFKEVAVIPKPLFTHILVQI